MADYREISQGYAQGGIKAAILLNGGAAVAVLTQLAQLTQLGMAESVRLAMVLWVFGVTIGAAAWLLGFLSTRHVDKSERESSAFHLNMSNRYMHAGEIAVSASYIMFLIGCLVIALSFPS